VNNTKHAQKKPRLRRRQDRAWFCRLLWHLVSQKANKAYSYNYRAYTKQKLNKEELKW